MQARLQAIVIATLVVFLATLAQAATSAGSIALATSSGQIAQSGGSIVITVKRLGGATGAVRVSYRTRYQTAVLGDYTGVSGTLSWVSGDATPKTVSIGISHAKPFSGTKTFSIDLSEPLGGAVLGTPAAETVSIVGSTGSTGGTDLSKHGTFSMSSASYAVAQSSGSLLVTVMRLAGSSGAISVGYATADSTAHAGSDYTATRGVLSWANGDSTNKIFFVPLAKTIAFSGTKVFALAIAGPSGGANLGSESSAGVTITGSAALSGNSGAMGQVAASRLLAQATFGPTLTTVNAAATQTYSAWFASQIAMMPSLIFPSVPSDTTNWYPFWLKNVETGPDQLRQRTAFALSQIFVISNTNGALINQNRCMAWWYDMLVTGAFSNYRSLLEQVTLSVQMGQWLSTFRNDKPNPTLGIHADENYARELMQLFSIGLVKLNIDGSVEKNSSGNPVSTYTQTDVENLARVFTGWASTPSNGQTAESAWLYAADHLHPMVAYPDHHDTEAKTLLGGGVIPAGGTAASDLKTALDTIFNNPNVGPFIGKQLIQRLVTSNPSPAYVARVATKFNNNGRGVRGDLGAMVQAILTDPEAQTVSGQGKLREPLLRTLGLWRAFSALDSSGGINDYQLSTTSLAIFDEAPLQAPSVFNFFRPDYLRAGPLTDAGLVAPELQVTNENTLVLADNVNLTRAYQFIDSKGTLHAGYQGYSEVSSLSRTSVLLKTAQWEPYAVLPATLIDEMNLVLMQGQMSAAMKTSLVDYVSGIPANTPWNRVAEAAELIVDSPQYAIQR